MYIIVQINSAFTRSEEYRSPSIQPNFLSPPVIINTDQIP